MNAKPFSNLFFNNPGAFMKRVNDLTEEEIESHFEMSRRFRPSPPDDDKPILTEEELEQLLTEVITKQ